MPLTNEMVPSPEGAATRPQRTDDLSQDWPLPPCRTGTTRGRDEDLVWLLVLGLGSLALLSLWWLLCRGTVAGIRLESNQFLWFARLWLATAVVWQASTAARCSGITRNAAAWFDSAQPLEPGIERILLQRQGSDWWGLLIRGLGMALIGQQSLSYLLNGSGILVVLLPWLALLLWLSEGFLRILWRRVSERLILAEDRLVWHLGPCQVQIPYTQLEEVVRGARGVRFLPARLETVLVSRGPMTVVARPGWPTWLLLWLMPQLEQSGQHGLVYESCSLRPVHEQLALEAIAARVPQLSVRGTGLVRIADCSQQSTPQCAAPTGSEPRCDQNLLSSTHNPRVRVRNHLSRRRLLARFAWWLFPLLAMVTIQERVVPGFVPSVAPHQALLPLGWLAWFLLLGLSQWRPRLRGQRGRQRLEPPPEIPQARPFSQTPGRPLWSRFSRDLLCLMSAVLGLIWVHLLRLLNQFPSLALLEGMLQGLILSLAFTLLRRIGVARRGRLWLLNDRIRCDRLGTQEDMRYADLQEATLIVPSTTRGGAAELRLRSAIPVESCLAGGWCSLLQSPRVGDPDLPGFWQDRAWLVTLAEPERFLEELGPHVPHLVRCDTGWITPLPTTGPPGHTVRDLAGYRTENTDGKSERESAAQSTTNSTSRQ